jgi:hypothetical protein
MAKVTIPILRRAVAAASVRTAKGVDRSGGRRVRLSCIDGVTGAIDHKVGSVTHPSTRLSRGR